MDSRASAFLLTNLFNRIRDLPATYPVIHLALMMSIGQLTLLDCCLSVLASLGIIHKAP